MPTHKQNAVVYSSDTRATETLPTIVLTTFNELFYMRWQIWIAFKRGLVSSYRNTVLGIFWAIVQPLIPVSVYLILAQIKVLKSSNHIPFVLYIVLGMVIYLFTTGTILAVMNALEREKNILKKINYPISAVMFSNFGRVGFELSVRLVLVVPLLAYYGTGWHWGMLALPLMLIIILLFAMGVGMILAITGVVLPDIKNVANICVTYGLFVSSVIFPMPEGGLWGVISLFNPLNFFVNSVRDLVVLGTGPNGVQLTVWALVSVSIALMALKLNYSMEFHIKEHL